MTETNAKVQFDKAEYAYVPEKGGQGLLGAAALLSGDHMSYKSNYSGRVLPLKA